VSPNVQQESMEMMKMAYAQDVVTHFVMFANLIFVLSVQEQIC